MGAFTSALSGGTGDWNASATWGKAGSPPVEGTDYPGNTDTYTITAGDTVTVNGVYPSSSNRLGAGTINGTLYFSRSANTKLQHGHAAITISSTGILDMGQSTDAIPSSYTCELTFATTSNANMLIKQAGGKFYMYGAAAYYGSDYDTQIADDPSVSISATSGSFTTTSDMSAKWAAGQKLILHKGATYASYTNDFAIVSISSISGTTVNYTTIHIPGGAAAFYKYGDVINVSRNVRIYKEGVSDNIYATLSNSPQFSTAYTTINEVKIGYAEIVGFINQLAVGGEISYSVIRNSSIYSIFSCNYTNTIIISSNFAYTESCDSTYTNCVFAASACVLGKDIKSFFTNCSILGIASLPLYYLCDSVFDGCYIYSCQYPFTRTTILLTDCSIGKDSSGNVKLNTYDFSYVFGSNVRLRNCDLPSSPQFYGRNTISTIYANSDYLIEYYDQGTGEDSQIVLSGYGDATRIIADGGGSYPNGNHLSETDAYVIQISAQSNCTSKTKFMLFDRTNSLKLYATGGESKTYKFYVQNNYTALGTDFILKATYYDSDTYGTTTTIASSNSLTTRGSSSDWDEYVSLTINPGRDGIIIFWFELTHYESGKYIWLDPLVEIS